MRRVIPVILAAIGLVILCAGTILFVDTLNGLSSEDSKTALAPIDLGSLDALANQHLTQMKVVIPDTAQWQRIRRRWGEPIIVISAISSDRRHAYCLADLKIGIKISEKGFPVHTQASSAPYGYSTDCRLGWVGFTANAGAELKVAIQSAGQQSLPSGDLVVLRTWWNTKDKLVGEMLRRDLRPIAGATSFVGVLLLAAAAMLRRRIALRSAPGKLPHR